MMRVLPQVRRNRLQQLSELCCQLSTHPSIVLEEQEEDEVTWCLGGGATRPKLVWLLDSPSANEVAAFADTGSSWPSLSSVNGLNSYSVTAEVIKRCEHLDTLDLDRDVAVVFLCPFAAPRVIDPKDFSRTCKRKLTKDEQELFWSVGRRTFEILRARVVIAVANTAWRALGQSLLWDGKDVRVVVEPKTNFKKFTSVLPRIDRSYYDTRYAETCVRADMTLAPTTHQRKTRQRGWQLTAFFLEHSYYLSKGDTAAAMHWVQVPRLAWQHAEATFLDMGTPTGADALMRLKRATHKKRSSVECSSVESEKANKPWQQKGAWDYLVSNNKKAKRTINPLGLSQLNSSTYIPGLTRVALLEEREKSEGCEECTFLFSFCSHIASALTRWCLRPAVARFC